MKDIEWSYLGTWFSPCLTQAFFVNWYVPEVAATLNLPKLIGGYKVINYDFFLNKLDKDVLGNFFYSKMVQKDFSYMHDFVVRAKAAAKKFSQANYSYSSLDSFRQFVTNSKDMMCYWLLVHLADPGIERAIIEKCEAEKVEIYQAMAQIQPKGLKFMERDKEFLRLLELFKQNKLAESDVENFLKQYNLIDLNVFVVKPLTREKLIEQFKLFEPLPKAKIENLSLNWPELKVAEEFAFLRYHFLECLNFVSFKFRPWLRELATRHYLEYDEVVWCTYNEILSGNIPQKEALQKRSASSGYVVVPPIERLISGAELEREVQSLIASPAKVSELHGVPASPGKVSGIARIILSARGLSSVAKGDVLVVSETTPNFVPAMRIAAAIVTDKGGVTSHAAIVSRELGVPCVIGTKHATKVFKDGDKIEVDAIKGVVRKL